MAIAATNHVGRSGSIRLFLTGDVMTGRGVDQVMANPCAPILHEDYVYSALDYVRLAEDAYGPIPRNVGPDYVWGAALEALDRAAPDLRIVNLETSITHASDYMPKGINYRMSPENADCLTAAGIDCCVLANNHVLDWGREGLIDTLSVLDRLKIATTGAGADASIAAAPATFDLGSKGRVLVFAYAAPTSGTPMNWRAGPKSPGINVLPDISEKSAVAVCRDIARVRGNDDIVIVSLHWGPNWGYDIPDSQRRFARVLVDQGDVSVVHGHSSHHAKAIEVYRDRLILYGCGDFLNDYEGIRGYEAYRDDLAVMYVADVDPVSRNLAGLEMTPLLIRQFRLTHAPEADVAWLRETLDRESERLGVGVTMAANNRLDLVWRSEAAK